MFYKSGKQPMVATSTGESELLAQSLAAQLTLGVRELLLGVGLCCSVQLNCDSNVALAQIGGSATWRSRHYAIRAASLAEYVVTHKLYIQHVASEDMMADGLTKPWTKVTLSRFLEIGRASCRERV